MKSGKTALIAALALANSVMAANEAFDKGMKALQAGDFATSLSYLETALSQDPDNLQFGSEYRLAIIKQAKQLHPKEGQPADYDRCLRFFERITTDHPAAANAWLNYGFAVVDKIPSAGSISQVILANKALGYFTKSIEANPLWIGYYTRGASYLFWPKIFLRAPLAVADLEEAMKLQKTGPPQSVYLRGYVGLGDAYWKSDNLEKARAVWSEGLKLYPNSSQLKDRLARQGDDLKNYLDDALDPNKRVDTDLKELWMHK
jgi:tetratricopeptide (TPR) repeat protein